MLIREGPATELTVATRVLAHFGALAEDGRITSLLEEVLYVAGRASRPITMTPYDIAAVRLGDGLVLAGDPPVDVARYLDAHRARRDAASVALARGGELVSAPSVRLCAVIALLRARGEVGHEGADESGYWRSAVEAATGAGALIGALPVKES